MRYLIPLTGMVFFFIMAGRSLAIGSFAGSLMLALIGFLCLVSMLHWFWNDKREQESVFANNKD